METVFAPVELDPTTFPFTVVPVIVPPVIATLLAFCVAMVPSAAVAVDIAPVTNAVVATLVVLSPAVCVVAVVAVLIVPFKSPLNVVAVIVPAAKLPEASRSTSLFGVLVVVALAPTYTKSNKVVSKYTKYTSPDGIVNPVDVDVLIVTPAFDPFAMI